MKHIRVELVQQSGFGWNVFDENGQRMESVHKVEIVQEAGKPPEARVTFFFPRVVQKESHTPSGNVAT